MPVRSPSAVGSARLPADGDLDLVIVGAGITGIYQLYRAREAGFAALLLEAGGGVGGTWYWNRYPGARFDSESYTYCYLFSKALFDEWEWQERFAAQPEIERYCNHVVDRFDLRRDIRFGAKVTSARFDAASAKWDVATGDGGRFRARFLIAATGALSIPYLPEIPGREDFRGVSHHTGLWPKTPVEFAGKRVAVVGTGSSGVQLIPIIAGEVASLTVYQRSANWCTPLNNAPILAEEQAQLRAGFEAMCEALNTNHSGFLHPPNGRTTFDDPKEARWALYEQLWNSPGFAKMSSNYVDTLIDRAANAEWCAFIAEKVRSLVADPATAERLIPKDHPFGGKRPPYVTGYYETFNQPNVALVDLKETPILRVTPNGIETAAGERPFDVIVWATGFDFGTGALLRMGVRGRGDLALTDHWADGPRTYLGVQTNGFPNLFFPGGAHLQSTNAPRYCCDMVDFVTDVLAYARDHDLDTVEATAAAEDEWTAMVEAAAKTTLFGGETSYFTGANIPGKARRPIMNLAGRPTLQAALAENRGNGYRAFRPSRSAMVAR